MKTYINTKIIKDYMEQNNLTKKAFCKKAGISGYSLNKVFKGDLNIDIVILFKIAFAMDIHIKDMFAKV